MDGWEKFKIFGGIGSAAFVALAGYWFAGQVIAPDYPERPGYRVEGVAPINLASLQRSWPAGFDDPGEPTELKGYVGEIEKAVVPVSAATPAAQPAAPVDLGLLLASASAEKGKGAARVCGSCHTFEQGGADRVGPNLWAVVGRPVGGKPGFAYSPAVKGHGGAWTYEELDRYLASPAKAIPGNKMAFNGVRNPRDRANLIAYLGSLGPSRLPYPAPKAPAPAGGGAQAVRR